MVQIESCIKDYFVGHVYDVECMVDNLRPGELLIVSPLCPTDVSRDNADSVLHD